MQGLLTIGAFSKPISWFKQGLLEIGIVDRIPNDSVIGLDINNKKNKRHLARLKEQFPLDRIPVPNMISIEAGVVYMGCLGTPESCEEQIKNNTQGFANGLDERIFSPITKVTVDTYQIAETETTVKQWDVCVAHGGCQHMPDNYGWGRGDVPVLNVSWNDVQQYINWLNSVTSGDYRLPSNAEWEYAAKAGTSTRFPWGDDLPKCDQVRHGSPNWIPKKDHHCQVSGTWPVKSKTPNPWGLYHVIGNAAEWVSDCGRRAAGCDEHLNRGGNWATEPKTSVLHTRDYITDHRYNRVGFRLARSTN